MDVTVPGGAPDASDLLRRDWEAQVGDAVPIPPCRPVTDDDYRVRIHHSKVADMVVDDVYSDSIVGGTGGTFNHLNDCVVLHVVRRGGWRFGRSDGAGDTVEVSAGQFLARYNAPSWDFGISSRTASQVLILPAGELRPLMGDRHLAGPCDGAPLRVLMAHVETVTSVLDDLSPAAVQAARNAMTELVKGVLTGGVDGDEPQLAPALAGAAQRILEGLLTEPELSPRLLARELNVSVRTLHRAFADQGEPLMAYVRRRRIERALQDLTSPGSRLSVRQAAARWGFADSSHFVRACKKRYGQTPSQYARIHADLSEGAVEREVVRSVVQDRQAGVEVAPVQGDVEQGLGDRAREIVGGREAVG
ncbi:helix-turn-helix domain-containing protein [Streptomyces sp. yr375]|uniref:helix-turn-helix domain-containing protein n=1 Tax=Streptomyces sp. yr375 TaxID=1761906 RepID=UPI0015A5D8D7|nr:helix-turn-helix domain-containing protein [Streptomyces sp. yr375]